MSGGQTPRLSTSSPPSVSSSSTFESESGNSDGTSPSISPTYRRNSASLQTDHGHTPIDPKDVRGHVKAFEEQEDHRQRRHRARNSGGFLLQSASLLKRKSPTETRTLPEASTYLKGKAKVEDATNEDLIVPKPRMTHRHHRSKPLPGSSPLASEVTNAVTASGTEPNAVSDPDEISTLPSNQSNDNRLSSNGDSADDSRKNPNVHEQGQEVVKTTNSDHSIDPAQIVNLALNLSESRRRHFSAGRLSSADPTGGRLFVSSGQINPGYSSNLAAAGAGGSLRQHLQQQRRISRNLSPRSSRLAQIGVKSPQTMSTSETSNQMWPTAVPLSELGLTDDTVFNPSEATLLRAEKARLILELSYEYRRLLPQLPKLHVPHQSIPTTGKGAATEAMTSTANTPPENNESLGRVYNPLQYIRNRKVRGWNRKTFDAEADGWKDIDRVKRWVDVVVAGREDKVPKADRPSALPSFDVSHIEDALDSPSPVSSISRSGGPPANKPPRPRMDWITTPWDLLADAYWLDQTGNKSLIEDSSGNKLYPASRVNKELPPRLSFDIGQAQGRRSESFNRQRGHSRSPEKFVKENASLHEGSINERGRRRHLVHETKNHVYDQKGSQDRKSRWPRTLTRSRSSSSSNDFAQDILSDHKWSREDRNGWGANSSAALEKHMNELLAKELENGTWDRSRGLKQVKIDQEETHHEPNNQQDIHYKVTNGTGYAQSTQEQTSRSTRASFEEQRGRKPRTSFEGIDHSAPNSPISPGYIPSIAINLSPPASRSQSPKKKSHSRLRAFRPDPDKARQSIGETDFAVEAEKSTDRTWRQGSKDSKLRSEPGRQGSELLSPIPAEFTSTNLQRIDSKSSKGTKEAKVPESRLRSLLKGGRIAEIIGNEVSRVGDLFWRKDGNYSASPITPSISSFASEDSDLDDNTREPHMKSSEGLARTRTRSDEVGKPKRLSPRVDQPKYYMNNLPSFRPTTTRDNESPNSIQTTQEDHHISRQQLALRERNRSSKFDRLAPPRIDIRDLSPSPSPPMTRTETRGTDTSYDYSRQSSTNNSERISIADRRLNAKMAVSHITAVGGLPISGLASLDARQHRSRERQAPQGERHWSISDRGVSAVRGNVTKRDIAV
ncbi:hypothetical protein MMC12_008125, partial [Toensbergia leucococca]|nr:hypothetical protein [Toensbergia leucococca]